MEQPAKRVGSTVRAELARRKISHGQLAAALDISGTAVWRRLNGDVAFDIDELHATADFLGLTVADLIAEHQASA